MFVLSTGRVGTETLTALAALSPQLEATHEPYPRLVKASFDAYLAGAALEGQSHWRELVLAARDDMVRTAARKGTTYVETNNRLTYLAPVLAEVFPAARFVHLYRHPYDFVRSAMRRRYFSGHDWDFARVRPRPGEALATQWDQLSSLERCAWLWARTNGDAQRWLATLAPSRRLALRSEDMFGGRQDVIASFFAFCGVETPPPERVKDVLGARLNAQQQGEFPDASSWSADDLARVRTHVIDVATALGYSLV